MICEIEYRWKDLILSWSTHWTFGVSLGQQLRIKLVFLIEPQAFFFFSQINPLTLWLHSPWQHACSHKLDINDFHVLTSCLLSGPDTKCSICQANIVVYVCLCVCILHVCVMAVLLFRCVGVSTAGYAKQLSNAFTAAAYTMLIYSMCVCVCVYTE